MADSVIFQRAVSRRDPNTDVFVSLTTEGENEVFRSTPKKLELFEGMGYISPIVVATFVDGGGDLFNHMKINTGAIFTLAFGRTFEDSVSIDLRVSRVDQVNTVFGRPHDIEIKITFISANWFQLLSKRFNKGWANVKYSDVVSEIASECGFSETSITESEGEIKSVIQPYWTNRRMFEWIRKHARPLEGDTYGHYEFGATLDNRFFFESTDDTIKRQQSDIKNGTVPLLRLQSPPQNPEQSVRSKSDNKGIPTYFMAFNNQEFFASGIQNGAGGYESMYFDWETDEYVTEVHTFDQEPVPQLSDLTLIREQFKENTTRYYGGRDSETPFHARNSMDEAAHSMQQLSVTTEGTPFINVFDIIELMIPNTNLGSKIPISAIYSGFYVVASARHHFTFDDGTIKYSTEMNLSRHGVDQVDYDGFDDLIESSRGKI
jgi:hypothetical protein